MNRRWPLLLGFPVAAIVLAGASSPWIAQRVPRFFFPALAIAGAALALAAFGRAVGRAVQQYRTRRRLPVLSLLINSLAVVVIVALPLTRLVSLMRAPAAGAPRILAGFGDWLGGEGYPRLSPHRGVDVGGRIGDDVLAAADGPHGYHTVYCHLSAISVQRGDSVTRGQRIGALGTTGQRAWPGYEHVHLELQRGGDTKDVEDPLPRIAGCFDPKQPAPPDRLLLTYPVKC